MLSWMKATRSFSFSSLSTTDACEMPIEASCVSDFTISGNGRRLGRRIGRPMRNTSNSGHGNAVIGQQLLRQRLVARQQQAARIAAGVRQLQQLEVADDVLVEDRDVVEAFEQVERDVRLPVGDRRGGCRRGRRGRRAPGPRGPSPSASMMTSYSVRHGADSDVGPLLDRRRRDRGAGAPAPARASCVVVIAPPDDVRCAGSSSSAR